jgi:hypothetical protein
MFTARLQVKSSQDIRLHRLIICRSESLALQLIEKINATNNPLTISNSRETKVCYASLPIGSIQPSPVTDIEEIKKQIEIVRSPHLSEVNTTFQNSLQLASAYGLESVVQKLLALNENPNHRDGFGRTALYYAAQFRHNRIIQLLIDNGARIDLRDSTLSLPFNAYLNSDKQPRLFDSQILSILQIDYLALHRFENGALHSATLPLDSKQHRLQKFNEEIDALRRRADQSSATFGWEFYQSRREHREPEKQAELNFSRETLIIMLKIVNAALRLPDECYEDAIRNQSIIMSFQFFGGLVDSLAKETKCPYQDRIPWNNLVFLAYFFKQNRVFTEIEFVAGIKLLIKHVFPVIKRELNLVINEFPEWLSKNQHLVHIPPYRHADFKLLYNLTDYFHDLRTLSEILRHLEQADSLNPGDLSGRYGLLQIIKIVADLAKYQHAGRNLTRTVKQKFPIFPWNEFGELRDKLAKIGLSQEVTDIIQNLLENDIQFFVELKKELKLIHKMLNPIYGNHKALQYSNIEAYYQDEPIDHDQARKDLNLAAKLPEDAIWSLTLILDEIVRKKTESLVIQIEDCETQTKKIDTNTKIPIDRKTGLKKSFFEKSQRIIKEIDDINSPFNSIKQAILSNKALTLEAQRFLLANSDEIQRNEIKKIISNCSPFKNILQLESRLSMKVDKEFSALTSSGKLTIIKRAQYYFEYLSKLVIPDNEKKEQLYGNSNIFEPGYDEFSSYLINQYNRIQSDPNLVYAIHFLVIEIQQSLRFIGLGGNQAFRIHLEHDEPTYDAISSNRLPEDLNEVLKYFVKDLPELKKLQEKYTNISLRVSSYF